MRTTLFFLTCFLTVSLVWGAPGPGRDWTEGPEAFDETHLLQTLAILEPKANTQNASYEDLYEAARVCLYLSRCQDLDHHRDEAKKMVERGIRYAQGAAILEPQKPRAHSLLALLYGTQIGMNDFFAAMSIGPKGGQENKKAQALAPNDAQTLLALGTQYVMAPPIGGGDVKKGVLALNQALQVDPKLDEAYYWLAKAYRKQNDRAHFDEAIGRALKLNPANRLAQKEKSDWR